MQARRPLVSLLFLTFATITFAQQQATFNHQTYAAPNNASLMLRATGDLNNDGYTDVVTNGPNPNSVYVILSNGNSGGFQPAREYPAGASDYKQIVTADVDGDGNADVVLAGLSDQSVFVLYGKGDGTLSAPVSYPIPTLHVAGVVVADFTGDGKKDIVAVGDTDTDGAGFHARLLVNNGGRKFTAAGDTKVDNSDTCCDLPTIEIGDFDGDGHADFFVKRTIIQNGPNPTDLMNVVYGDGAGNFTAKPTQQFQGNMSVTAADLNGDGKSDIVGTLANEAPDTNDSTSQVLAFFGSTSRTMTQKTLATVSGGSIGALVADYNGDGALDVAFMVDGVNYFALQQSGAFTIQTTGFAVVPQLSGDFNHDGRQDLAQVQDGTLDVLYNDTQGGFNYCLQPAHGISDCGLDGSTITINAPNVMFNVGAADFSPIRKLEVWENGTKLIQQFYAYSDYAFMSLSHQFSTGKHTVTLLATGYDHLQMKKDVTFTVGSSTSGCSTPTSSIHVCDPVDGSAVSAPSNVHAIASGVTGTAQMQVWVDGVKKASQSGSHLDVHFTLGTKGKRQITFYSLNSAGTRTAQKTLTMTVQ